MDQDLTPLRLADHETVVARCGTSGPAVVLVHAAGLDHRMWEPVLGALSVGRRVFAYDVRCHGRATGAPSPFTMAEAAADLIAVLDALGLGRAHVAGLSYGGAIAQTAAVAYPDRFASLALLATTDRPFCDAFEARARSVETAGMAAQVAPSLTRWFTPEALAENGWGVRYARDCVLGGNSTDWAATWRAFKTLDVRGGLVGFTAPALVVAGTADAATALEPTIMADLAGCIPGAVFAQLPGVPHLQTLERPELVAAELGGFLPAG